MIFKRRRRTEQELLLRDVDDVLKQLLPLCGALLLGKRRVPSPPELRAPAASEADEHRAPSA